MGVMLVCGNLCTNARRKQSDGGAPPQGAHDAGDAGRRLSSQWSRRGAFDRTIFICQRALLRVESLLMQAFGLDTVLAII
jgi:hypothetical protein